MNKIDFRWIGVAALAMYALASLSTLSWRLHISSLSYFTVLFLFASAMTIVLAEIWAVMYWRASRTKLALMLLMVVNIILACNLSALMPAFTNIFNRAING